jgi:hypothetical protein
MSALWVKLCLMVDLFMEESRSSSNQGQAHNTTTIMYLHNSSSKLFTRTLLKAQEEQVCLKVKAVWLPAKLALRISILIKVNLWLIKIHLPSSRELFKALPQLLQSRNLLILIDLNREYPLIKNYKMLSCPFINTPKSNTLKTIVRFLPSTTLT